MATNTTNFNLAIYEGGDYFNPLVHENGNAEKIDAQMFRNLQATAGKATELVSGTVHAITRTNTAVPLFHFTATGNWKLGDTMTVNGVQVSVLYANGTPLAEGAYVIGGEVFGYLRDTLVTIINASGISGSGDIDADTFGGEPPEYYATKESVDTLNTNKANKSIGVSAQLTVAGWSAYGDKFRQTVAVSGVTTNNNLVVAPAPTYRDAYVESNVQAVEQGTNSITFEADAIPSVAMYANVIILG